MVRELRYHQIRLGVVSGSADVESVQARSIGSFLQTRRLCAELDDINTLKVRNGEAPFASFEEVVDAVRADEHPRHPIPGAALSTEWQHRTTRPNDAALGSTAAPDRHRCVIQCEPSLGPPR